MLFILAAAGTPAPSTSKGLGRKTSHVRPTYIEEGDTLPYTFQFEAEVCGKQVQKITTGDAADKISLSTKKKEGITKVRIYSSWSC